MKIPKSILCMLLVNTILLAVLVKLGLWKYYLVTGFGISIGMTITEGFSGKEGILGIILLTLFWPAGLILVIVSDWYRIQEWWFKTKYKIKTWQVERFVHEMTKELCGKYAGVYARITTDDNNKPKLLLEIWDYEELVNKEDEIKERVAKEFGVPKEKIEICWNDEWRYDDW